jgi:hypothetical protein
MSKNRSETRKVELVETHNLALAIDRLREAGSHDCNRWKRALYHALAMTYTERSVIEKIRVALELP